LLLISENSLPVSFLLLFCYFEYSYERIALLLYCTFVFHYPEVFYCVDKLNALFSGFNVFTLKVGTVVHDSKGHTVPQFVS
jgi:hypothetical protein